MKRVLNVGGGAKSIPIPLHYEGWEHVLLDIDPRQKPDVVCDARELGTLPADLYDAVYCSHNLEHYWRHDAPLVVAGFAHVLRGHGFAEVAVPDLKAKPGTAAPNRFYVYGVVARLGLLAASLEMERTDPNPEVY